MVSPFFGKSLGLIEEINSVFAPDEIVAAIDPNSVKLPTDIARSSSMVRFVDVTDQLPVIGRKESWCYPHAKVLWFEEANGTGTLLSGSANASAAAFLGAAPINAECVVFRRGVSPDEVEHMGLLKLFSAPEIATSQWAEIEERMAEQSASDESPSSTSRLAVLTDAGYSVDVKLAEGRVFQAFDANGAECDQAVVISSGSNSMLSAPDDVYESALTLVSNDFTFLVHRPEQISENYLSDTRRALRQAVGSIDDDPAQLKKLLQLCEKVIFKTDDIARDPSRLQSASLASEPSSPSMRPESLAITVLRRGRAYRRRASLAQGDITVLLDALIHRLSDGLETTTGVASPSEEELVGSEDAHTVPVQPPRIPDQHDLANHCSRKVKTLLRKMGKQLLQASEPQEAVRVIVQVAAVLGVVRALCVVERRPEWLRTRERLVDPDALWEFFLLSTRRLAAGKESLAAQALSGTGENTFEELSISVGTLVWLAWENGVDLHANRWQYTGDDNYLHFLGIQALAYLGPLTASDQRALDYAVEGIEHTPRRGQDHEQWLTTHATFLDRVKHLGESEDTATMDRSPATGDLAILTSGSSPRVLVVQSTKKSSQGEQVELCDYQDAEKTKFFLASKLRIADAVVATAHVKSP